VTNEQFLYLSYFASAAAGVGLAVISALILARPHRLATAGTVLKKLGGILRRALPSWLILAVLLGFISVSYLDCSHHNYAEIVADRPHLIDKTQEHLSRMSLYLAVALTAYGFVLALFLWARARQMRRRTIL